MSLAILVAFAQDNFGDFGATTTANPPRLRIPQWLLDPTDPLSPADHTWRIEDPPAVGEPLPDLDRIDPDALAFYIPFHFRREGWGIYLRASGVRDLASRLKGSPLKPGDEAYLDLADSVLYQHELIHATAEIACTRAELLARTAVYHPYFSSWPATQHEEALANASAVRRCFPADPMGARSALEKWMSRQGPGYRDFGRWVDAGAFSRGQEDAATYATANLPRPAPKASSSLHTFLFRGARNYSSLPVTLVHDLGRSHVCALRPFARAHGIQVLVHTNDHPPPHIHIQLLRDQSETRYRWPELLPLKGEKALAGAAKKALSEYLRDHGQQIGERVRAAYPGTAV